MPFGIKHAEHAVILNISEQTTATKAVSVQLSNEVKLTLKVHKVE